MENVFSIRLVDKKDAEGILGIYAPYVRDTIISFEYDVPTLDAFSKRVENISEEYPWVVCLLGDRIIGYAYAGLYRSRRAYQWGVESTIYMEESFHGRGIARILYNTLFSILKIQGMLNIYAVISFPNEKSTGFHKSLGFSEIGIFKNVGYKFDSWHDVQWMDLYLGAHTGNPPKVNKWSLIRDSNEISLLLRNANLEFQKL